MSGCRCRDVDVGTQEEVVEVASLRLILDRGFVCFVYGCHFVFRVKDGREKNQ